MLSSKESYGNKGTFIYFIGYMHEGNDFPMSLCIKLPQMIGCVKYFGSNNKCINHLVYDKELLKNIMKYGITLLICYKEALIVNQCEMINTIKLG